MMRPPNSVMGHEVWIGRWSSTSADNRDASWSGVLCHDCIDALPREKRVALRFGRPIMQSTERRHCTECGEQMTGPIQGLSGNEPPNCS